MFTSINEETPKSSKHDNLPGHDDSGFDGSSIKMSSVEPFNAEKVRFLLETVRRRSLDKFWMSVMNYMMVVVVVASVCYILMMGEKGGEHLPGRLGGKRAAIQHYYDSVYGTEAVAGI